MGRHSHHNMHRNSVKDAAAFGERERLVLDCIAASSVPLTDREVMKRLGFVDPNAVRPAITHLRDRGAIVEDADVKDALTNRMVRATRLATPVQGSIA